MKSRWYGGVGALMLLSVTVTGVCLAFMPAQVPMHYNAAGEMDRLGSKYECLLFPAIILICGLLFILAARWQAKKENGSNEKVLLICGAAVLGFFNLLFGFFLVQAAAYDGGLREGGVVVRVSCIGAGFLFCILGNIMPKARCNSQFGLRTVWSMKNDRVWQKCQRLGGISMVVTGLAIILGGIFLPKSTVMIGMLVLVIADGVASIVASYRIYKRDLLLHPEG